jgi:hypothetical protein
VVGALAAARRGLADVPRFYLSVATPLELLEVAAGAHHAHNALPPPGMAKGFDPLRLVALEAPDADLLATALYVAGSPPAGTEDDWYWSTLGDFLLGLPDPGSGVVNRILTQVARAAGKVLSDALTIPLVKRGTALGQMKWLRITHRGILGGGVEQFQFKVDLGNPGSDPDLDQAARDALAETLAPVWVTAFDAHRNYWDSSVRFTELGVAQLQQTDATDKYGKNGNQAQIGTTSWHLWDIAGGTFAGGGLGPALPYETSMAVSLQTAYRGASGRGRLFLPPHAVGAMDYGGTYTDSAVSEAASLITAYFAAVKAATPYEPIVVSPRRMILNTITSINVGKVPDSQRRRRRSQDEARVMSVIA